MYKKAEFTSGTRLIRIHAGIDDEAAVLELIETCELIFATHYVYERLLEKAPLGKKIIRVDLDIDPDNLDFILSHLEKENL